MAHVYIGSSRLSGPHKISFTSAFGSSDSTCVVHPSPAVIQEPAEKYHAMIYLLHVYVSALLLLPSLLPYTASQIR